MIDVKKLKEDLYMKNHTLYCSVMAHLRGKLHMTKLNGSTFTEEISTTNIWDWFSHKEEDWDRNFSKEDRRRHMFPWTMEDQEKYVKDTIEEYTIKEKVKKINPEPVSLIGKSPSFLDRVKNVFSKLIA